MPCCCYPSLASLGLSPCSIHPTRWHPDPLRCCCYLSLANLGPSPCSIHPTR
ncbi:hypothetical protein X976_5712 [Burkholderia pseudomallei MSHR7500]|nr:hypothetical protein X976_5712 [Burkholderia pseudomallei MSHR7500]